MFCVGLTGNIASGKSTVSNLFAQLGIDIIDADNIARDLVLPSTTVFKTIVSYFGQSIVKDGDLDRKKLRHIIFNSDKDKKWLERLLHPLIRNEIIIKMNQCKSPYCIIEIPLLFDKKAYPYLNRVATVISSEKKQLDRLRLRDKQDVTLLKKIIDSQPKTSRRIELSDDIIENNGTLIELKKRVDQLHQYYLTLSVNS
jgi:dephospho-CoA kinase